MFNKTGRLIETLEYGGIKKYCTLNHFEVEALAKVVSLVLHIFSKSFSRLIFFKISLWKLKVGFIFLGFDPIPSITLGFAFWQQSWTWTAHIYRWGPAAFRTC